MSQQSLENSTAFQDMAGSSANDLIHDILNNNQIAMGYLELALEQITQEDELRSMLCQVHKALLRSSDLALTAYRYSRVSSSPCEYAAQAGLRDSK